MNSLKIDRNGDLVLVYDTTGNHVVDYLLSEFISVTEFKMVDKTEERQRFILKKSDDPVKLIARAKSLVMHFSKNPGLGPLEIDAEIKRNLEYKQQESNLFEEVLEKGLKVKHHDFGELVLGSNFQRKLKEFQKKSVIHFLEVKNAANFSVPGSGKTTMTYAALSKWLEDKIIEKIMVICPTAAFVPWEDEYEGCFGKKATTLRIRGEQADSLHDAGGMYDLFVLHYQTANIKRFELMNFLKNYKTALIVDESHRIKNPDLGPWAEAVLFLAPFATRRIILSGTPMPNNYQDLWTQITFLWPHDKPFGNRIQYNDYVKKCRSLSKEHNKTLDALFSRIMKKDLNLPKPEFERHVVKLGDNQREIYDIIAAKTLEEINSLEEQSRLQSFRTAKMIRLLQSASNPSLLYEMSHEFDVNNPLFGSTQARMSAQFGFDVEYVDNSDLKHLPISAKITNYSKYEIPSKIRKVASLTKELVNKNEKVIIWSSFLLNMKIYQEDVLKELDPIVINGQVSKHPDDEPNRDALVKKFKEDPACKVLIATPASLGESVSLHKNSKEESVCRNAIYLDRNFNGAQFMQSMDRIHRIGMPSDVHVKYHFVIGENTIDEKIDKSLLDKWNAMTMALNDPYFKKITFDVIRETDDEFTKDYDALVEHLRHLKSMHDSEGH